MTDPSLSDCCDTKDVLVPFELSRAETRPPETMPMTLADQAAMSGHGGRVTSSRLERPKRRTFTAGLQARILAEFDALPRGSPERSSGSGCPRPPAIRQSC